MSTPRSTVGVGRLGLLAALALLVSGPASGGCTGQSICADTFANAAVTDVLYDDRDNKAYVAVLHRLSYCTNTDEKRFSIERLEIDLDTGNVFVAQRATNTIEMRAGFPEACCDLMREGSFGPDCPGCELILRSRDRRYTFHFIAQDESAAYPMTLDVSADGSDLVSIDIGGYDSTVRP